MTNGKGKIMIIDDSSESTLNLSKHLKENGYVTITIEPNQSGSCEDVRPDVLLVNGKYVDRISNYDLLKSSARVFSEYTKSEDAGTPPMFRITRTVTPASYVSEILGQQGVLVT